jgi:hypothetical protein
VWCIVSLISNKNDHKAGAADYEAGVILYEAGAAVYEAGVILYEAGAADYKVY